MTRTPKPATFEHKFVGRHLDDLADGRILEPGGMYELTQEQIDEPHNQRLIEDGLLITTDTKERD